MPSSDFPSIEDILKKPGSKKIPSDDTADPKKKKTVVSDQDSAQVKFTQKMKDIETEEKEQLVAEHAAQLGLPYIDLSSFPVSAEAMHVLPEKLAREKKVELQAADVQAEYEKMIMAASTTMPNVGEFLAKSFGWNEEDFRQNVVRPALLENRVAMTYGTTTEEQITKFQMDVQERMKADNVKIYLKY
jgi:hypothetical protein